MTYQLIIENISLICMLCVIIHFYFNYVWMQSECIIMTVISWHPVSIDQAPISVKFDSFYQFFQGFLLIMFLDILLTTCKLTGQLISCMIDLHLSFVKWGGRSVITESEIYTKFCIFLENILLVYQFTHVRASDIKLIFEFYSNRCRVKLIYAFIEKFFRAQIRYPMSPSQILVDWLYMGVTALLLWGTTTWQRTLGLVL